jgi:hypothetical protein
MFNRLLKVGPWNALLSVGILATCGVVLLVWTERPRADSSEGYYGVRLGMSPRQVRANFSDAELGSWRKEEAKDYELAHWERGTRDASSPMTANFVFYDGQLTAIQLKLGSAALLAQGTRSESTDFTELSRAMTANGVVLSVTLRCCALNESSEWSDLKRRWLDG